MSDPEFSAMNTLQAGLSLVSLSAYIDAQRLFGAALGGWLATNTRRHLKSWQKLGSLLLSAGVGYLFTPEIMRLAPFLSNGGAAFICALTIIPISIKVMMWVDGADIWEILNRLRGGK